MTRLLACFLGVLFSSVLIAQTNHRLDPRPPHPPNVFDRMEKQTTGEQPSVQGQDALRLRRKGVLDELNRELPQLIELAQKLQEGANSANLDAAIPADLNQQADQLEKAAKEVRKRVRGL